MDGSWTPYALDAQRSAQVFYYPSATPLELVTDTAASNSPGATDLSAYATSVKQESQSVSVTLSWHHQLDGTAQPAPGEIIELRLDDAPLWWGVIEAVNDYRLERGTRALTLTVRSRDGSPLWREVKRVTDIYPTATPLALIAREIAESLGLTDAEMLLPASSGYTVHSNTQLAELSAWEMLETLYLPGGYAPFVDARGRLKTMSRDTARPSDIVLTDDRLLSVNGSRTRSPVSRVRIKWLDPNLTYVAQQDQVLGNATITAGFFVDRVKQEITFSDDGTQRASDTTLVIRQSANAGLVPVCEEEWEQQTQTSGTITLTNTYFAAALATAALVELYEAGKIPDAVQVGVTGTGFTISVGRLVHVGIEVQLMLAMMSIGTGVYEIHGTPYDYVHARNITEAYDCDAPEWVDNVTEIENDFVMSEDAAQAFAVRELLYLARSASNYGVTIVDDPRIEPGDIIELNDGSRLYVTDYSRDLTRGAAAVLDVQGFRI